jgi:hypothetical protein
VAGEHAILVDPPRANLLADEHPKGRRFAEDYNAEIEELTNTNPPMPIGLATTASVLLI